MCFGKKEKPQPSASQQEKSGPRPASTGQPRPPNQTRASDQRPASRRQSQSGRPVSRGKNPMGPQPGEGRSHRRHSISDARQLQAYDQGRAEKRRSRLDTPGSDGEIIIAVMGVTGAGKSYFIREVTGNPEVKVSDGLYSSTIKVQPYSFEYLGKRITLVDTPGFDDTNRSDTEVLKEIADWTSKTYKKGQLLSGIIYLHPITHTRMEGSAMRNLRMFQKLCGQEVLKNVLLTTTQWSKVDRAEGEFREDNLRDEGLWGGLIGKGATLQRFHGTRESGFELIHKLLWNKRKPLDIQYQIVEQNMTLLETNAGKCINVELIAQEKKFREKLEFLEKRLQEAIKMQDGQMNQALMQEHAKTLNQLEMAETEMKWLMELHAGEVKKRQAREREEEARISDKAVIAVATKDIAVAADITGMLTSYKTRGRLILDIQNREEFESDTFEVTINYKPSPLAGIRVYTSTSKEEFNPRIGDIVMHGVHYRCKYGISLSVGSQEFVIFSKD